MKVIRRIPQDDSSEWWIPIKKLKDKYGMTGNKYQREIYELFQTRIIAYPVEIAKVLKSPKAALFLSQLLYWHARGAKPDWIYKTVDEFYFETGLSRKAQNTAIKILKELGIVEMKLAGVPPKRHFKTDLEAVRKLLPCVPEVVN